MVGRGSAVWEGFVLSFRERPEYQGWREAVFQLFGQKCIRCGYAGNLHAHHVMPVDEYPELAFEPTNGVPLCGNCHVAIKGNELSHADELKSLQRAILEGETAGGAKSESTETALREQACAEPSNEDAVNRWFEATADSKAVVDFWERHHDEVKASPAARFALLRHLIALGRWQDIITEADGMLAVFSDIEAKGAEVARREGQDPNVVARQVEGVAASLASVKAEALSQLGRHTEAVAFLREMVVRFPESADLHRRLSVALRKLFAQTKDDKLLEECQHHTIKTAELAQTNLTTCSGPAAPNRQGRGRGLDSFKTKRQFSRAIRSSSIRSRLCRPQPGKKTFLCVSLQYAKRA